LATATCASGVVVRARNQRMTKKAARQRTQNDSVLASFTACSCLTSYILSNWQSREPDESCTSRKNMSLLFREKILVSHLKRYFSSCNLECNRRIRDATPRWPIKHLVRVCRYVFCVPHSSETLFSVSRHYSGILTSVMPVLEMPVVLARI